jgi:predicted PurR-regulated permease PerM
MIRAIRISYIFIVLTLIAVGWLHLATPLITALFAYFALDKLNFTGRKWMSLTLFVVLACGIFYAFAFFLKQAFVALPQIVSESVPSIIQYAQRRGLELPFDDVNSLKALLLDTIRAQLRYLGNFARIATKEFVFLVIGLAVAISIFLNPKLDLGRGSYAIKNNLYSLCSDQIAARFRSLYHSFAAVMGAQVIISVINTLLTSIFVLSISLPYSAVVIGSTFLCGLIPIIGNLISNSVIVGLAFTISPQLAVSALVFLVALHKLEYFLNSKIIGDRIKNPFWLTLLGLILGERLLGIPGMVLAIEPMVNMGTYKVKVLRDGWTVVTADGKPSAHFEHSVAVTEDGPVILSSRENVQ